MWYESLEGTLNNLVGKVIRDKGAGVHEEVRPGSNSVSSCQIESTVYRTEKVDICLIVWNRSESRLVKRLLLSNL